MHSPINAIFVYCEWVSMLGPVWMVTEVNPTNQDYVWLKPVNVTHCYCKDKGKVVSVPN